MPVHDLMCHSGCNPVLTHALKVIRKGRSFFDSQVFDCQWGQSIGGHEAEHLPIE